MARSRSRHLGAIAVVAFAFLVPALACTDDPEIESVDYSATGSGSGSGSGQRCPSGYSDCGPDACCGPGEYCGIQGSRFHCSYHPLEGPPDPDKTDEQNECLDDCLDAYEQQAIHFCSQNWYGYICRAQAEVEYQQCYADCMEPPQDPPQDPPGDAGVDGGDAGDAGN